MFCLGPTSSTSLSVTFLVKLDELKRREGSRLARLVQNKKYMGTTRKYSLRQILRYAYQLRNSMGPVDISTLPEAMILANEKEIIASGGKVELPDWRRE